LVWRGGRNVQDIERIRVFELERVWTDGGQRGKLDLIMVKKERPGYAGSGHRWQTCAVLKVLLVGALIKQGWVGAQNVAPCKSYTSGVALRPGTHLCPIFRTGDNEDLDFRNVSLEGVTIDMIQMEGESSSVLFGFMDGARIGDIITRGNDSGILFFQSVTDVRIQSITTFGERANIGFSFSLVNEIYFSQVTSSFLGPIRLIGHSYVSFYAIESSNISSISTMGSDFAVSILFYSIVSSNLGNIFAENGTDAIPGRVLFISSIIRHSSLGVVCASGTNRSYVQFCSTMDLQCTGGYFLNDILSEPSVTIAGVHNTSLPCKKFLPTPSIGPTSSPALASSSPLPSPTEGSFRSGLSPGTTIGIVLGSLAIIGIVSVATLFIVVRKRASDGEDSSAHENNDLTPENVDLSREPYPSYLRSFISDSAFDARTDRIELPFHSPGQRISSGGESDSDHPIPPHSFVSPAHIHQLKQF